MQDDVNWKLSLLLDDELDTKEAIQLLERIHQDPELLDKWCCYNAMSQAIRFGSLVQPDKAFMSRIRASLAATELPQSTPSSTPTSFSIKQMLFPLALAASVATVTVLLTQPWEGSMLHPSTPVKAAASQATVSSSRLATVTSFAGDASPGPIPGQPDQTRHYSRFEDYLIAHSEGSLYATGPQGMLSYARIVSHDGR